MASICASVVRSSGAHAITTDVDGAAFAVRAATCAARSAARAGLETGVPSRYDMRPSSAGPRRRSCSCAAGPRQAPAALSKRSRDLIRTPMITGPKKASAT